MLVYQTTFMWYTKRHSPSYVNCTVLNHDSLNAPDTSVILQTYEGTLYGAGSWFIGCIGHISYTPDIWGYTVRCCIMIHWMHQAHQLHSRQMRVHCTVLNHDSLNASGTSVTLQTYEGILYGAESWFIECIRHIWYTPDTSMISCQKGPTRHAYAWQIGSFWQDTLDMRVLSREIVLYNHNNDLLV